MSYFLRKWASGSAWAVDVVEKDPLGQTFHVRKRAPKDSKEKDARQYEHDVRVAIREGKWCKPHDEFLTACECAKKVNLTLKDFSYQWQARNTRECAKGTVEFYQLCLDKHVLPQLGHIVLSEFKGSHAENLKAYLVEDAQLSKNTVNNNLATLRALVEYGARLGHFGEGRRAPVIYLLSKDKRVPPKYLTVEEQNAAHDWVAKNRPEFLTMFVVMLETGLRIGEIIALQWSDIVGDTLTVNRTFYLDEETAAGSAHRSIPLSPAAMAALKGHRHLRGKYVFPIPGTSERMRKGSDRQFFEDLTAGIGVDITAHTLRHTFATNQVSKGTPLKTLSVLMGHASVTTTEIYGKVLDEALRAAVGAPVKKERK